MATEKPPDTTENALLVRVLRERDRTALRALHERYYLRIKRYIVCRLGPNADVDDLAQDVFVSLFSGNGRYDGYGSAEGYLLGVARNVVRRHARQTGRRLKIAPSGLPNAFAGDLEAGQQHDPLRETSTRETEATVSDLVAHLSPKMREAVRLRFIEQLDSKQAAQRAKCSPSTFDKRVFRAIRVLRKFHDRIGASEHRKV
jgi:RNA polymerase sigma-70 factor (ECF subfamily)